MIQVWLVLTFISHGVINHEAQRAPDWDTCVRWRHVVRLALPDKPDVVLLTGCEWRRE